MPLKAYQGEQGKVGNPFNRGQSRSITPTGSYVTSSKKKSVHLLGRGAEVEAVKECRLSITKGGDQGKLKKQQRIRKRYKK